MKYIVSLIGLFTCLNAFSAVIQVPLDQDIAVSAYNPSVNYSSYETYLWVGTNHAGINHESMFGFNLSDIDINRVLSISFNAYIPLRHGDGGEVFAAVGLDNNWDENLVTYSSHGGLYGDAQDSNILDNKNLNTFINWSIDVNDVSEDYLTVYLSTNSVGIDGTNFHDIAGVNYLSGRYSPYLDVKISKVPISPIPLLILLFTSTLFGFSSIYRKRI